MNDLFRNLTGTFYLTFVFCFIATIVLSGCGEDDTPTPKQRGQLPVIRGNVSNATADKPQSKLWYAHGRWWAWLPTATGSRVWSRSDRGWVSDATLEKQLQGLAGRADVWADEEMVRAVLVASNRIVVATLTWDNGKQVYRLGGKPTIWPLEERSSVETATITRDALGHWWIAYDRDRVMWVRRVLNDDTSEWSEPIAVSQPAASNDFCTIVALPDEIGVFWSDHIADAFLFRRHKNDSRADDWEEIEVIVEGPGTVDDHLNAAVAADGTLYVATRSGGGPTGQSHLQLHVRRTNAEWTQHSYADDSESVEHSRPIVFLSADSQRLHLCHSVYTRNADGSRTSHIAHSSHSIDAIEFKQQAVDIIVASIPVNSVSGPKSPLPAGISPLILASDTKGNIYEGRP